MSSQAAKKRKIYWLSDNVSVRERELGALLTNHQHHVRFFSNWDTLSEALAKQRVSIIVLSDSGPDGVLQEHLLQLSSHPDVQGSRLILSRSRHNPPISTLAACSSFRDIIPDDLSDKEWLSRFIFATARARVKMPEFHPRISLNEISSVAIPSRLAWIGDHRLLFEARVTPPVGSRLTLTGSFASALGLKRISLQVEEVRKSNLIYRFSDAIIARWQVPETSSGRAESLLETMRQTDFGPRIKVFLAVSDANIRNQFIRELDPLRFELNVALQKSSIVDEPKYFTPKIVFIEAALSEDLERFQAMQQNIPEETPIYILGQSGKLKLLQQQEPKRKIAQLNRLPTRLSDAILTKYLNPEARKAATCDPDATHISQDHPFSMCEVLTPVRLTSLNPHVLEIQSAIKLGNFGLCKVEAPILRKNLHFAPFAKIVNSYELANPPEERFSYVAECLFSDLGQSSKEILSNVIVEHVTSSLLGKSSETPAEAEEEPIKKAAGDDLAPIPIKKVNQPVEEIDVAQVVANSAESIADAAKSVFYNKTFRQLMIFCAVTVFIAAVFVVMANFIEPRWTKSGSQYTKSLRDFAPHKFKEGEKRGWP